MNICHGTWRRRTGTELAALHSAPYACCASPHTRTTPHAHTLASCRRALRRHLLPAYHLPPRYTPPRNASTARFHAFSAPGAAGWAGRVRAWRARARHTQWTVAPGRAWPHARCGMPHAQTARWGAASGPDFWTLFFIFIQQGSGRAGSPLCTTISYHPATALSTTSSKRRAGMAAGLIQRLARKNGRSCGLQARRGRNARAASGLNFLPSVRRRYASAALLGTTYQRLCVAQRHHTHSSLPIERSSLTWARTRINDCRHGFVSRLKAAPCWHLAKTNTPLRLPGGALKELSRGQHRFAYILLLGSAPKRVSLLLPTD